MIGEIDEVETNAVLVRRNEVKWEEILMIDPNEDNSNGEDKCDETREGMIGNALVAMERFDSFRFPPKQSNDLFNEFREKDRQTRTKVHLNNSLLKQ